MAFQAPPDLPASRWDKRYARRQVDVYASEDNPLFPSLGDKQTIINAFLENRRRALDPPEEYRFTALRAYMATADPAILLPTQPCSTLPEDIVLLDDRQDTTGGTTSTRLWDSAGEHGYLHYPPIGDRIHAVPLGIHDFVTRLREKRKDNGAEKRTIYISNLSPECALALAATVNTLSAPLLRNFLNRHLSFRVFFDVSMALAFEFQLHIPFFALRRRSPQQIHTDKRFLQGRRLRASRKLPLARNNAEEQDYYHEAHISFLVAGVDEWFWIAYCCVDTYFGSEPESRTYLDGRYGSDPATGGSRWLKFPIWNPREYFLFVLARRITQATREWSSLIDAFEERMVAHEETTLFDFLDDAQLTRTKELTLTVSTLRRFRDSLSRTIVAWDSFEERGIDIFETTGSDAFRQRWEGYLEDIRRDFAELKSLQTLLTQKLEHFNGMRDGLVNASALRESAAATRQGEYIGLLTRMTVLYLPLSLSTGIFSITMVPSSNITWVYYTLVSTMATAVTLYVAAHPRLLSSVFRVG